MPCSFESHIRKLRIAHKRHNVSGEAWQKLMFAKLASYPEDSDTTATSDRKLYYLPLLVVAVSSGKRGFAFA
jgi:hypothetical protein